VLRLIWRRLPGLRPKAEQTPAKLSQDPPPQYYSATLLCLEIVVLCCWMGLQARQFPNQNHKHQITNKFQILISKDQKKGRGRHSFDIFVLFAIYLDLVPVIWHFLNRSDYRRSAVVGSVKIQFMRPLLVIGVWHLLELRLAKIANRSVNHRPPSRFAHPSDKRPDNAMSKTKLDSNMEYDPVFLHSRREAVIIFCLWVTALIWVVPFCYFNGYGGNVDPGTISMIMGIPMWLFWGIFVPWLTADAFTIWFCFFYMKDDELGESNEGGNIQEELADLRAAKQSSQEGGA